MLVLSVAGCAAEPEWPCGDGASVDMIWIEDASELERFRGKRRVCGDLYLRGEVASLDALAALEVVEGALLIDATSLSSLAPLGHLRRVEGHLGITNNDALESVSLPALTSVGGEVSIVQNLGPLHVDLPALEFVGGVLLVASNPSLAEIRPMPHMISISSIQISANPALERYEIPSGLTSVGEVQIVENQALLIIEGGASLADVETMVVFENPALEVVDIAATGRISFLGIASNPALTTIAGFDEVVEMDGFVLVDNDSLSVAPGFAGVSILAGFAGSLGQLIAARAGLGVFAALVFPATLAIVTAIFTNGLTRRIYQVPLATFGNVDGLIPEHGGVYRLGPGAGALSMRGAGIGGAGNIKARALESSTVDLAEEFSNLIMTQRAYSASSKIITTSELSVFWMRIDSSGVRKSLSPLTGELKRTPSSLILRRAPSEKTWKPPESVRMGPSQAMNGCRPPKVSITSRPGRSHRWKVLPRQICAPMSSRLCGVIAFTVP